MKKLLLMPLILFSFFGCTSTQESSIQVNPEYKEMKGVIRQKIKDESEKFTECYTNSAEADNYPKGKLTLRFTISPMGQVTQVSRVSENTTLESEFIFECFKRVISKIKFPEITSGQEGDVIYPFVFRGKDP
jgi:hypothetical protein